MSRKKYGEEGIFMSSAFKRYSGYTITAYLNRQLILVAKNYLATMPTLSLA